MISRHVCRSWTREKTLVVLARKMENTSITYFPVIILDPYKFIFLLFPILWSSSTWIWFSLYCSDLIASSIYLATLLMLFKSSQSCTKTLMQWGHHLLWVFPPNIHLYPSLALIRSSPRPHLIKVAINACITLGCGGLGEYGLFYVPDSWTLFSFHSPGTFLRNLVVLLRPRKCFEQ